MDKKLKGWKDPAVLLLSLGIAGIGDFIYLVAINIIVYQMTGSATAVAGLWIVGPIVNILTKFWTGSFIDYRSKKSVIIFTYLLRAGFIALIPLAPNVLVIYVILVFLSIAKSFFGPSSVTYITMLVPTGKRKRFNSIHSFTSSGAFIIGPSIGGVLILSGTIETTLWINALFFVLSALLVMKLPKLEDIDRASIPSLTGSQMISDFKIVKDFIARNKYITFVYLGFTTVLIFSFAMDAQEVVFTQQVIGLSELDYSLLISLTGIGSLSGGLLLSVFSAKISIRSMMVYGLILTTIGYVVYAFSWSFISVMIGFLILGFFIVFMNAGIATFYQNNVPVALMGRITSIFQLFQSTLQIVFLLGVGLLADFISLRITIVALAVIMLAGAVVLAFFVMKPGKAELFEEEEGMEENVYVQ